MNHKEIDIENIKEWLGNMEHRMKKYTVPVVDIPEGDNNKSLRGYIWKDDGWELSRIEEIRVFRLVHTEYLAE